MEPIIQEAKKRGRKKKIQSAVTPSNKNVTKNVQQYDKDDHSCLSMCSDISKEEEQQIYEIFSALDEFAKAKFINDMVRISFWIDKTSYKKMKHRHYLLPMPSNRNSHFKVCKRTFIRILRLPKKYLKKEIILPKSFSSNLTKCNLQEQTKELSSDESLSNSDTSATPSSTSQTIIMSDTQHPKIQKTSADETINNLKKSKILSASETALLPNVLVTPIHINPQSHTSSATTISHSATKHCKSQISNKSTLENSKSNQKDNYYNPLIIKYKRQKMFNSASVQTDISIDARKHQDPNSKLSSSISLQHQSLDKSHFFLKLIKNNPMLFLGISNFSWINGVIKCINCTEVQLFLILYKIRLNNTLEELMFYFSQSESDVIKVLNVYIPLIYDALMGMLDWQDANSILFVIPPELHYKFDNLRSILKLIKVHFPSSMTVNKFFISITPLGLISYVSEIFSVDVDNITMMKKSTFLKKVPKKCGIIVDNDLKDTGVFLNEHGFTVFLDRNVDDAELVFSGESVLQRDIKMISQKARDAHEMFVQFRILHYFPLFLFNDDKALYYIATIIAALVNINIIQMDVINMFH